MEGSVDQFFKEWVKKKKEEITEVWRKVSMLFRRKNLKKIQKQSEWNQKKGITNNESKAKKTK